jgi:asparagine synthetase B (glutamine-hydrolysing)
LLGQYAISREPLAGVHAAGLLGEAIGTASLWATYFNNAGAALLCPFMDSRMLRVAVNIEPAHRFSPDEPKKVLKEALRRYAPHEMVYRPKRGFGQPIFEWLAPGGQLRPLVDAIGTYDFVKPDVLEDARSRPNWFLYSLLCYDLWHKLFIEKALSSAQHSNHHD